MSSEVVVPVTSEVLAPVYKVADLLPFNTVREKLQRQEGTLVFMSPTRRVVYGISYSKRDEEFLLFLNYDGVEHMSKHESLSDIFTAYALCFEDFRYLALADLEAASLDYRSKETAKARTNER